MIRSQPTGPPFVAPSARPEIRISTACRVAMIAASRIRPKTIAPRAPAWRESARARRGRDPRSCPCRPTSPRRRRSSRRRRVSGSRRTTSVPKPGQLRDAAEELAVEQEPEHRLDDHHDDPDRLARQTVAGRGTQNRTVCVASLIGARLVVVAESPSRVVEVHVVERRARRPSPRGPPRRPRRAPRGSRAPPARPGRRECGPDRGPRSPRALPPSPRTIVAARSTAVRVDLHRHGVAAELAFQILGRARRRRPARGRRSRRAPRAGRPPRGSAW